MKRLSVFEFEDFSWCPQLFRRYLTNYLRSMHRLLKTETVIAPLLERCLRSTGTTSVLDLCSGAGGPIVDAAILAAQSLEKSIKVTMSDLYPNQEAIHRIAAENNPQVTYLPNSVDASHVPPNLEGVRTMICCFHHLAPALATSVLRNCFEQRKALCVFEISDNSQPNALWWVAIPISLVVTLLVTPLVRPLSLGQLFFTYVIPVMPIMISWDGAASNARTYTKSDLEELIKTARLEDPRYKWEIETIKKKGIPGTMLYLLGLPQ